MNITIHGDVPSKKNSRVLVYRGGRAFSFAGSHHSKWHKEASKQLLGKKACAVTDGIELVIYPKTKRKSDLTNKAESVMDLLVDNGIIEDDNWFCVGKLLLKFGGVDKVSPRAVVTIQ